jgi:acyl-CoA synthetase (AMP-forming)/AMP-acid ligase II
VTELAPPIWQLAGVSPQTIALEDHRRRVASASSGNAPTPSRTGSGARREAGDHVTRRGNRVEFEALIGAMRAGMLVTPVKTSWTAAEIEYVLRDAGSRAVVTDVEAAREAATAAGIATIDLERGVGGASFEHWLATQDTRPLPGDRKGWRLSYTSGTTGRPKGVHRLADGRLPWCEAFVSSRSVAATARLPTDGPHLNVSALFHGAPLAFALSLLASGTAHPAALGRRRALDALPATCARPAWCRPCSASCSRCPHARRRAFRARAARRAARRRAVPAARQRG